MFENLMEAVLTLFESVIFVFTQLINILGAAIVVPGVVILILAALVWKIAWSNTKNVVGTVIAIFSFFAVTYLVAAFIIFPWIFKGSDAAMRSCVENATNQQQKKLCTSMLTADYVISAKSIGEKTTAGLSTIIVEEPEEPVNMVRTFEADALILLTKGWNTNPPDWPRDIPGQLVGPKDVPQDVILKFKCDNPIATLKNEQWTVTISGVIPGIGERSVTLQTNGFFARDKDGFNAKPGTSIIGTGTWEETCPDCYVDKIVIPTPAAQPTQTAVPAIGTKVPFKDLICGYWGWLYYDGEWKVVPTTGGQADFSKPSSAGYAAQDIANRCPGQALPAKP